MTDQKKLVTAIPVLLAALGLAVAGSMVNGAIASDLDGYQAWSRAFAEGDILQSTSVPHANYRGNNGLPFNHYSPGPGQIVAVPMTLGLFAETSLKVTGYFAYSLFWFGWLTLATTIIRSKLMVAIATSLLFIATPTGIESLGIDSELMSLMCLGTFMLCEARLLISERTLTNSESLILATGIGVALAMQWQMRAYLILFGLPALGLLVHRLKRDPVHVLLAGLCLSFPVCLAVWQWGTNNYWQTGEFTRNAYSFGDAGFSSMDYRAPFVWHVFTSPYHGILPRHPIYLMAIVCLIAICVRSSHVRFIWRLRLLAVLGNIWMIGSWYFWSMAHGCGNRGVASTGPYLILALSTIAERSPSKLHQTILLGSATLCAGWSFLQMMEPSMGSYWYADIIREIIWELRQWLTTYLLQVIAVTITVSLVLRVYLRHSNEPRVLALIAVAVLSMLMLFTIIYLPSQYVPSLSSLMLCALIGYAVAVAYSSSRISVISLRLIVLSQSFIFLTMLGLFIRLNTNVQVHIQQHDDEERVVFFQDQPAAAASIMLNLGLQNSADRLVAFLSRMKAKGYYQGKMPRAMTADERIVFREQHWATRDRRGFD